MKKVLLTTTAIVGLSSAAFAEVNWSGDASLGYNDGAGALAEGINTSIGLAVTMSNDGGYTATVAADVEEGGSILGSDVDITTPVASIHYGEVVEAANSAYTETDGLSGIGSDEFTAGGAAILISASTGGMSVGFSDFVSRRISFFFRY
jgi:hypothetical protein